MRESASPPVLTDWVEKSEMAPPGRSVRIIGEFDSTPYKKGYAAMMLRRTLALEAITLWVIGKEKRNGEEKKVANAT